MATELRRDHEVNWGDKTKVRGPEKKTLAWISVHESSAMTVYAWAAVRGVGSEGVVFLVNVEWGHGGASIAQDFPVVQILRVPLAASMVKVHGRLIDANGNPPPVTVTGDIAVFIAPGADGETLRNTRWVSQSGAAGTLSLEGERVMRVEGYNAGADTWLMVFDGTPTPGAFPAMARPVRAGRTFAVRRFDSQSFRSQVSWGASATPLTWTPDPSASLRIDAEFLL